MSEAQRREASRLGKEAGEAPTHAQVTFSGGFCFRPRLQSSKHETSIVFATALLREFILSCIIAIIVADILRYQ